MPSLPRPLPSVTGPGRRARWRRVVLRRVLAGGCASAAAWLLVTELRPPPPPSVEVVTAAAAVPAGTVLTARDVTTTRLPEDAVQPGALTDPADALGRRLASGLAPGESLTRTRLVPRTPAEGLGAGRVALHVTLADPVTADVVRAGQEVVVFPALGGAALARSAVVLATDPPVAESVPGLGPASARGVVLGLPAAEAEHVLAGHGGLEGPVVVNLVATGST